MEISKLKEIVLIICVIIFLLLIVLFLSIYRNSITGKVIEDFYTYTKAICNQTDYGWFCQDYIIECNKNKTESISLITGAIVKHPKSWQDPRGESDLESLCD